MGTPVSGIIIGQGTLSHFEGGVWANDPPNRDFFTQQFINVTPGTIFDVTKGIWRYVIGWGGSAYFFECLLANPPPGFQGRALIGYWNPTETQWMTNLCTGRKIGNPPVFVEYSSGGDIYLGYYALDIQMWHYVQQMGFTDYENWLWNMYTREDGSKYYQFINTKTHFCFRCEIDGSPFSPIIP